MPNASAPADPEHPQLLRGAGMRGRIEALDRSKAPPGEASGWPQALRAAIGIMLASPDPMLACWGPELILFYNDACIPLLGRYHPLALGQPAAVFRADPFIAAVTEAVMADATRRDTPRELAVACDGFSEEAHLTFSCSPIPGEDGAIGGQLCLCSDETPQVLAARRTAALGALAERGLAARSTEEACAAIMSVVAERPRDVPFALLYLLDEAQARASLGGHAGIAPGTAISPESVALDAVDQALPLAEALATGATARPINLSDRAGFDLPSPWPEPATSAVVLPLPRTGRSGTAALLVAGLSPRLAWDDGYRGFLDLFARQAALVLAAAQARDRDAHRTEAPSEREYRLLFDSIDEGFCTVKVLFDEAGRPVDYVFLETNAAFAKQTGLTDAVGKRMLELAPDHERHWFETYGRIAQSGRSERFELRAKALGFWYDVYAFRTGAPGANRVGILFKDISARKRSEAEIEDNRRRFRALVTAGAISIFRMSPDWAEMHQLDSETMAVTVEPTGGWLERYIPETDRTAFRKAIGKAVRTEALFELEHRVLLADGSIGWVMSRAVPLRGPEGEIVEWFGAATDITARREATEKLRETEERLRRFGEASQDVLWIRDAETLQWVYLSSAFETTYGVSRDEAMRPDNPHGWQELILPEDRPGVNAMLARVRAGEAATFRYRVRRPSDGEIRWLHKTDFPIADSSGKIVYIGGISRDMTDAMRVQDALSSSEERLGLAVSIARLGLWDWNMQTDEVHWSDEHYLMEGYGIGEVTPSYAAWVDRIHPEDREATEAALRQAMENGSGFAREFRTLHPDGSVHWLAGRGRFFYEDGVPVRMIGAMMEVTEQRESEDRQKVLMAELQHRTHNLMGVIRAMADRTLRSSPDLATFRLQFNGRLNALARVQALLSRLNDHDRVTFDELLQTELMAMDGAADRVTLTGPAGIRLRSSTVQMLGMALHELATNAVKYGALGQASGRLAITWHLETADETSGPWLHIDWREQGVVMADPDAGPRGTGQGRELIERALPYQLKARTSYVLGPDGLHCAISIPVSASHPAEDG